VRHQCAQPLSRLLPTVKRCRDCSQRRRCTRGKYRTLALDTCEPARQRARIALEIPSSFSWPADNDPAFQDRLRDLVNQKLAEVQAFVLFDQADRFEIEFPSGWQELKIASALPR